MLRQCNNEKEQREGTTGLLKNGLAANDNVYCRWLYLTPVRGINRFITSPFILPAECRAQ
jgi:hypothetical protein